MLCFIVVTLSAANYDSLLTGWDAQACPPVDPCNENMVLGVTEFFDASHKACEILVVGPSFIAEDDLSISLSRQNRLHPKLLFRRRLFAPATELRN